MEPHRHDTRTPVTPQVVFGLIVILVGIVFTLDSLGIAYAEDYLRYWPVALIAIGLAKLWSAFRGFGNPIPGVLFTLAGSWILLHNFGIVRREIWNFWPLILVFAGSMILWQGLRGRKERAATTADANATTTAVAVWSGIQRQSTSSAFRGAELTAFMGGVELDLRRAAINGDAVVDVFAMWGGIEIKVPETWTIIDKVTPFMGGVEDKTRQPATLSEHRLTIRGMVIMGGVEIKN